MRFRSSALCLPRQSRNTLRKFSVVSQLPCISPGGIAQRLGFTGIVGIFVVTHTWTEFKAETVYRAIQKTDDHNPRSTHRALDSRYKRSVSQLA